MQGSTQKLEYTLQLGTDPFAISVSAPFSPPPPVLRGILSAFLGPPQDPALRGPFINSSEAWDREGSSSRKALLCLCLSLSSLSLSLSSFGPECLSLIGFEGAWASDESGTENSSHLLAIEYVNAVNSSTPHNPRRQV